MLVNWTKDNIKGIPLDANQTSFIVLAPGYNDVDDADWIKVRWHVIDQIEAKVLEEEWIRVKKDEATKAKIVMSLDMVPITDPNRMGPEVFIPATIKDFNKTRAISIVMKTYSKPTLDKWNEIEGRDEVTKAINYELMWIDDPSKAQDMYGRTYGHKDSKE